MRSAFVLLAVLLAALPTSAQREWESGVAALVPVEAYARPASDGVWTDMRPFPFKGSDEELAAVEGATLYAGPAPQSYTIEAWHARFADGRAVNCEDAATVCAARIAGPGGRSALVFPFGTDALGVPPGARMRVVPRLRLSDAQSIVLGESDMRAHGLVLGDGNALTSDAAGTALLTTRPRDPDCGDPQVTCGVVFEIETTDAVGLVLF